jgi:ADP-ribose pyrophosphatase YjhB (NUDIX family)
MKDTNKVAKILVIKSGRVLLLFSKHLKKYHLPGGHLHENETFLSAVKREFEEETSIKLHWDPILIYSKPNFQLFRKIFKYNELVDVKLSEEHENFVWAAIKEADKYPICDITKRDIYHLQKHWICFKNKKNKIDYSDNEV